MALGMFERAQYRVEDAVLEPGDMLVLYSDGVTEAEDDKGQPFEDAGLEGAVRGYGDRGAEPLADAVFRLVENHTRNSRIFDDITILGLRRLPPLPVAE
jgi:sigma-B regulation protein RsbU (phosphoserine phosphatase)